MGGRIRFGLFALVLAAGGCFYPPQQSQTQAEPAKGSSAGVWDATLHKDETSITVEVPYDLTWDAVHKVAAQNNYKVQGDDPDNGIVEAESHGFTLKDANCGQEKGLNGKTTVEVDKAATAVYIFKVKPAGPNATSVHISSTFTNPLHIPFRPVSDEQCVSRGVEETRLLDAVARTAQQEQRPSITNSSGAPPAPAPSSPALVPGSDILKPQQ
jgi:hypothetical protein